MQIEISRIKPEREGDRCYVHARGLIMPDGFGIITTQKLELSGSDVFYGLEMTKTRDGGKSFGEITRCKNLDRRYFEDGTSYAMCDATPFYHKASGKIILIGHIACYGEDNALMKDPRPRSTSYAVYNYETEDFDAFQLIEHPDKKDEYFSAGSGCTQVVELPSGELLIPFYYKNYEQACDPWNNCSSVAIMKCTFDGKDLHVIEIGNALTVDVPRGLCEPSLIKHGEGYYLALRNDVTGFVARSCDGLHFDTPVELCFDDGENAGNYNTQQHWLTSGNDLYMVYTRRAGTNDHVFRHRAPLFIAKFDTDSLRLVRESEMIAVPERGARLGNFGCQSFNDEYGYIFASEWMQCGRLGWDECAKHGSDNTIFISKVIYE